MLSKKYVNTPDTGMIKIATMNTSVKIPPILVFVRMSLCPTSWVWFLWKISSFSMSLFKEGVQRKMMIPVAPSIVIEVIT